MSDDALESRIGTAAYRKLHQDENAALRQQVERLEKIINEGPHEGAKAAIAAIKQMRTLEARAQAAEAALQQRDCEIAALREGLEKAKKVINSKELHGVIAFAHAHNYKYTGPVFTDEEFNKLLSSPNPGAKVAAVYRAAIEETAAEGNYQDACIGEVSSPGASERLDDARKNRREAVRALDKREESDAKG